jgi:Fe-S oxidoreductase
MINEEQVDIFLKKCIHCGFCKPGCPMYMVYKEEKWSARGIIFILRDIIRRDWRKFDKWDFLEVLYACTLCGNCLHRCPAGINTPDLVLNLRRKLLSDGIK